MDIPLVMAQILRQSQFNSTQIKPLQSYIFTNSKSIQIFDIEMYCQMWMMSIT